MVELIVRVLFTTQGLYRQNCGTLGAWRTSISESTDSKAREHLFYVWIDWLQQGTVYYFPRT